MGTAHRLISVICPLSVNEKPNGIAIWFLLVESTHIAAAFCMSRARWLIYLLTLLASFASFLAIQRKKPRRSGHADRNAHTGASPGRLISRGFAWPVLLHRRRSSRAENWHPQSSPPLPSVTQGAKPSTLCFGSLTILSNSCHCPSFGGYSGICIWAWGLGTLSRNQQSTSI